MFKWSLEKIWTKVNRNLKEFAIQSGKENFVKKIKKINLKKNAFMGFILFMAYKNIFLRLIF